MAEQESAAARRRGLSLDAWAVALAVVLALLVRFHWIHSIPW